MFVGIVGLGGVEVSAAPLRVCSVSGLVHASSTAISLVDSFVGGGVCSVRFRGVWFGDRRSRMSAECFAVGELQGSL